MEISGKAVRSGTASQIKNHSNIVRIAPPSRQSYETYEHMKRQFLLDNPLAEHKEIEAASQRFKDELGL